jgi:hypothetical protein
MKACVLASAIILWLGVSGWPEPAARQPFERAIALLARAAELAGDSAKAKTFYARLVAVAAISDSQRPELQQARAFLGKP